MRVLLSRTFDGFARPRRASALRRVGPDIAGRRLSRLERRYSAEDAGGLWPEIVGDRPKAPLGCLRGGAVGENETGELVHAAAGELPEQALVGHGPGAAALGLGTLFAGKAEGAALVGAIHIPGPGDRG